MARRLAAVPDEPEEDPAEETPAENVPDGNYEAFLETLNAGDFIDLDDVTKGALSRGERDGETPATFGFVLALAWIHRRRKQRRLTWPDVRGMSRQQTVELITELTDHVASLPPKADSASD